MYAREDAEAYRVVDRWEGGVGWQAFPEEGGQRTSHAVRGPDGGVWLVDPLDAPGVDDCYADLGEVAGVAVLADYHARDAAVFAERHGVPVTVPTGLDRVADRLDVPTERATHSLAGFELRRLNPLRAWRETVAYREADGTLYVPDFFAGGPYTVGPERLSMRVFSRLFPPRETFADLDPERILLGHGAGVFEDADDALEDAIDGARRRFLRALLTNGPMELKAMVDALR
ncbi:hypothetical protein [Haloarcula sp. JP-L23]|uniref:hypothetical protein n=1 Tax=Haloarcula sp. JP-L23 TaxID=2716717 RepID=UPI00140F44FA|nr:hypothetical protein G9465_17015 [Haloarcula sp. JP-L23]